MSPRSRQQGAALAAVLLILLVVMVLGLASMRGAVMQERMSGNQVARDHAFQAAEAALREAEAIAAAKPPVPANGCTGGLCAMPRNGTAPAWATDGFWDDGNPGFRIAAQAVNGIRPRFVVEDYGIDDDVSADCTTSIDVSSHACSNRVQRYRITVLSRAGNGAEVVLQSHLIVP